MSQNAPESPPLSRRRTWFGAIAVTIAATGVFIWWMWFSGPACDFSIAFDRYRPKEMRFSPDGRYLAVVGQEPFDPGKEREDDELFPFETPSAVRVLEIPTGNVVAELPSERVSFNFGPGEILKTTKGMLCCAWSADGSTLAVGRALAGEVNLFDTKTWKLTRKLKSRDIPESWLFRMTDLSFDRWGNLYAAENPPLGCEDPLFFNPDRPACVWWNTGPTRPDMAEYLKGIVGAPVLSLSAASFGANARLAITYGGWFTENRDRKYPIEIRRVLQRSEGEYQVKEEFDLVEMSAEEIPRVCFTPDGGRIAVLANTGFWLWKLDEIGGEVIASARLRIDIREDDPIFAKLLEVSRDGRFVSYTVPLSSVEHSKDSFEKDLPFRTTVVRVADGAQVFSVTHPNAAATISPDGTLLAVGSGSRERICFYRIPQEK